MSVIELLLLWRSYCLGFLHILLAVLTPPIQDSLSMPMGTGMIGFKYCGHRAEHGHFPLTWTRIQCNKSFFMNLMRNQIFVLGRGYKDDVK